MKKVSLIFSSALLAMLIASCGGGVKNTDATEYVEAIENAETIEYVEASFENTEASNTEKTKASSEVTIGTQVWMTKNLDADKFRNGDPIPQAKTDGEWEKAGEGKQPAWCYYDNDPANGAKYGKLYNWYAVNDPRGLAPEGWHIPSDAEWTLLTDYLGGEDVAGKKMKSTSGWDMDGNGTNESGLAGLPSGFRNTSGPFYGLGLYGYWWSSSDGSANSTRYRELHITSVGQSGNDNLKSCGFSVRYLRD